jgi:nicotinamide-nucleotide amidase
MDAELLQLSESVGQALLAQNLILTTAESCTGGWVAAAITATAGSSEWYERGFVTYSNAAKVDMLGVAPGTLDKEGAVSEATASEMAAGALAHSRASIALAITGIAGPTGGSPGKPVGTVCFAWCRVGEAAICDTCCFPGDRNQVRYQAVMFALQGLLARLVIVA